MFNMRRNRLYKRCLSFLFAITLSLSVLLMPIHAFAGDDTITMPEAGHKIAGDGNTRGSGETTYYMGDVNIDGKVNTGDATTLLRSNVGLIKLYGLENTLADANADGKVNTGDAVNILGMTVGIVEMKSVNLSAFTVKFTSEYDSDNVPNSFLCVEGDNIALPDVTLTYSGFTFVGWIDEATGTSYAVGADFEMRDEDVEFSANWRDNNAPREYEITIQGVDIINDVFLCETTVTISETTLFKTDCIALPEGFYFFRNSQKITVTVDSNGPDANVIVFNMYAYDMIDGEKYIAITTAAGFEYMREHLTAYFILHDDVDMGGERFTPIGWQEDGTFKAFHCILDGAGHKVYNFNCDWWEKQSGELTEYVGLIAMLNGTVKNLRIETTTYEDNNNSYGVYGGRYVGAICGAVTFNGKVENCSVYGCIGTSDSEMIDDSADKCGGAGGITGANYGTVTRCSALVAIDAYFYAGGLVGKNFDYISESWAGIVANVNTPDELLATTHMRYIGGLAGGTAGTVENCYALIMGLVQSNACIGGLFGTVSGGILRNMYVAVVDGGLSGYSNIGLLSGYCFVDPEEQTGIFNYTDGVPYWPEEYSTDIWDMEGESHFRYPDLKNNRRPDTAELDLNDVSRIMN